MPQHPIEYVDQNPPTKDPTLEFFLKHEASIPYVYDDHVGSKSRLKPGDPIKGYPTAGIGHKLTKEEVEQYAGKQIPQQQINEWFAQDLLNAKQLAQAAIGPAFEELSDNQQLAVISYVFNAGNHALKKYDASKNKFSKEDTNFVAAIKAGDIDRATAEMNITRSGGKEMEGLRNRRRAEQELMKQPQVVEEATDDNVPKILDELKAAPPEEEPTIEDKQQLE